MTERLYYTDARLRHFGATITESANGGTRIVLDRSAFYPVSGGQPFDLGTLGGKPVIEVTDEGDEVIHTLAEPLEAAAGTSVDCEINWQRRRDHMQQHTGQHLLSAVIANLAGWETLSFHMGADVSTIEIASPAPAEEDLIAAERRANEIIAENRPVLVTFEDTATVTGLRKLPARTGVLRVVSIEGIDRSACGGTHVQSTGGIGCVLLRGTEKIRGNTRLEFLCGLRAIRRARADYGIVTAVAGALGSALDAAPQLVRSLSERLAESEKSRTRLLLEAARALGRQEYQNTQPAASGLRICRREVPELSEELRAEAQSFTAGEKAIFIARSPAAVLFAVSADSGLHAGNLLKPLLALHGGRGGGSAQTAQASLPAGSVHAVVEALSASLK